MTTTFQSFDPPDDKWAKQVCKVGQGQDCCRYITMAPDGFSCAKHTGLRGLLDLRAERKAIIARGDNCLGRGAR
jgi:hypothetical protein